jgi:hypothetical protein
VEGEDEPAPTYVDIWESQYVAEEFPVGLRVDAKDYRVSSDDHISISRLFFVFAAFRRTHPSLSLEQLSSVTRPLSSAPQWLRRLALARPVLSLQPYC